MNKNPTVVGEKDTDEEHFGLFLRTLCNAMLVSLTFHLSVGNVTLTTSAPRGNLSLLG